MLKLILVSTDSGHFPVRISIIGIYGKDVGKHWCRWLLKRIIGSFWWKVPTILWALHISVSSEKNLFVMDVLQCYRERAAGVTRSCLSCPLISSFVLRSHFTADKRLRQSELGWRRRIFYPGPLWRLYTMSPVVVRPVGAWGFGGGGVLL